MNYNKRKEYGKGYIKLYENQILQDALSSHIQIEHTSDNLILSSTNECYIEGIKQSISHLIGLVRGPQIYASDIYQDGYPTDYSYEYESAYKKSSLYYGTLLYNPERLIGNTDAFSEYLSLYSDTIGEHGTEIVKAIKEWDGGKHKNRPITVLKKPLTYQELFNSAHNQELLLGLDKVAKFYRLGKYCEDTPSI